MKQRKLLFHEVEAEAQAAIAAVEEHTPEEWRDEALRAIEKTCRERREFISDDVWEVGGIEDSPHDNRALGGIFHRAVNMGLCVKTDRLRRSKRSHLSGKPVWTSLIYGRRSN